MSNCERESLVCKPQVVSGINDTRGLARPPSHVKGSDLMKKTYEKPTVDTDSVFETLAASCTQDASGGDPGCDPNSVPGAVSLSS